MQFTRLIASEAMTDSVATANVKMLHMKLKLRPLPHASTAPVRTTSMTIKIWTTAWL